MTITPRNPITIRIHNNAYARFHQIFCRFARRPMFQYRYEENTLATFWTDRDTEQIYIHPDDFRDFHLATDINQPDVQRDYDNRAVSRLNYLPYMYNASWKSKNITKTR